MWICAGIASAFLIGGCLVWIWPSEEFNIQMDYNMITIIQEKIWKVVYGARIWPIAGSRNGQVALLSAVFTVWSRRGRIFASHWPVR